MKSTSHQFRTSLTIAFLLLFSMARSVAQNFEKTYKDPNWATQFAAVKRAGGLYYACGYVASPVDGIYYGDFSKIDLNGNILWTVRPFGVAKCRFFDFEETVSGDFIVVGRTEPLSDAQNQPINNRSVVCRITSNGTVVFARSYEFSPLGREGFWSIKRDPDATGTFFITGHTNGPNGPGPTDRVLVTEMNDAGVFVRASELLSTVVPAAQTDNEFFLKIDQPDVPTSVMWAGGIRRTVNSSITYGLITGILENDHSPVLQTLLDPGTTVRDILPEPTTPVLRVLGVGQKDGEAIFFAYYPQAPTGFIWSVTVSGQIEFLKLVKASTSNHYYVLGRTIAGGVTKYVVNYFDASGTNPGILWSRSFDQGELNFSDPGILATAFDQFGYFDTRLGNPGGMGKEVFLTNFDNVQGNCLAQASSFTATPTTLTRTIPDMVKLDIAIPTPVDGVATSVVYDQRNLCMANCSADCQTTTIPISTGYSPALNGFVAAGQSDPIWQLTQVPPNTTWNVPRPAFTITPPTISSGNIWDINYEYNNIGWISGQPTANFSSNNCGNPFGCEPCIPEVYQFERCFCVCAADSVTFDFSYMADDYAQIYLFDAQTNTETLLTGHDCDWHNGAGNPPNFRFKTVFFQKRWLEAGRYCLRAKLWNTNGVTMGLNIRGSVTGLNLEKDACCATHGTISGVNYHDLDCNGVQNAAYEGQTGYEPGQGNWIIQLCNANQNVVATTTTDATGSYAFFGVAPGTYTVKQVNQAGWTLSQPSSTVYTVTITAFGAISGLNFGNCAAPPCPKNCQTTSIQISTGYNPVSNNFVTAGQIDPIWRLTQVPPNTSWTVPRPVFVVSPFIFQSGGMNVGWDSNNEYNGEGWVSGQPTADYSLNNCGTGGANCYPCIPEIYQFERCFCLCKDDSITFDLSFMADDFAQIFLFDAQTNTETLLVGHDDCNTWDIIFGNAANFRFKKVFYQKKWLTAGRYCLRVKHWNTNSFKMGLNVRGSISGLNLETDVCCATYGVIAGVAFNDKNCDGLRNASYEGLAGYEPGLVNRIIQLCDANQNVVATSTTDATGSYSFFDVAPGTYTVKEVAQAGWTLSLPSSGSYTITMDAFGSASGLDFGNCATQSNTKELHQVQLRLSPNPTDGSMRMEWSQVPLGKEVDNILIVNQLGQTSRVLTVEPGATSLEANVTDLPAGIYLVKIETGGIAIGVIKMVKQ